MIEDILLHEATRADPSVTSQRIVNGMFIGLAIYALYGMYIVAQHTREMDEGESVFGTDYYLTITRTIGIMGWVAVITVALVAASSAVFYVIGTVADITVDYLQTQI